MGEPAARETPAAQRGGTDCVFFAQHLPENGIRSL
jgi:hypothetical protein